MAAEHGLIGAFAPVRTRHPQWLGGAGRWRVARWGPETVRGQARQFDALH